MAGGTMSGSGTALDPYQVEDALDLKAIESYGYGNNYLQVNDFTLGTFTAVGHVAGTSYTDFTGVYDGGGYTIRDGDITVSSGDYYNGIFARVNGGSAEVKNLVLDNVDGTFSRYGGLITGEAYFSDITNITIKNCTITWDGIGYYIGALVGQAYSNDIDNIFIQNVHMYSADYSVNELGFIAGHGYRPIITNCRVNNKSSIACLADGSDIGGIIGVLDHLGDVEKCLNQATIHGSTNVGGIVGEMTYTTTNIPDINDCHNKGDISAFSRTLGGSSAGGIVGKCDGNVQRCLNEGNITGVDSCGGIAGTNGVKTNIDYCYTYNTKITRRANSTGLNFGKISGSTAFTSPTDFNYALNTMVMITT